MDRTRILTLVACATLAGILPGLLASQNTKPRDATIRSVEGVVTLPDEGPVEGAVVKLKNLKTLQVLSYITQKDGKYQFNNLSTSIDYEIRADFRNYASKKRMISVFERRQDLKLDLKLEEQKDKGDSGQ